MPIFAISTYPTGAGGSGTSPDMTDALALKADKTALESGSQRVSFRASGSDTAYKSANLAAANVHSFMQWLQDSGNPVTTLPEIVAWNALELTATQAREGSEIEFVNFANTRNIVFSATTPQLIVEDGVAVTGNRVYGSPRTISRFRAAKDSAGNYVWLKMPTLNQVDGDIPSANELAAAEANIITLLDDLTAAETAIANLQTELAKIRPDNTIQFRAKELVVYANKGTLESQGALDASNDVENCFVDKFNTEMFQAGREVPTFRIYDKGSALGQLLIPAVEADFANLMQYGGYYMLKLKLDTVSYGGLFVGVQSVTQSKRYGTMISTNSDKIQLSSPDTSGMVTQVTAHDRTKAFSMELQIPVGMTPTDLFFNDEALTGSQVAWVTNSGGNNDTGVLLSSGSSSSTSRVAYMSEGGLVVYEQLPDVYLTKEDFTGFKNVKLITPIGRAHIHYHIPTDMEGRLVGDEITVICKNTGGSITFSNADPANPTTLINKETAFTLDIKGVTVVRMYNTLDNGNVYEVAVDSFTFQGDSYTSLLDVPILIGSDVDDGTGAKLQVTGDISLNGTLLTQ